MKSTILWISTLCCHLMTITNTGWAITDHVDSVLPVSTLFAEHIDSSGGSIGIRSGLFYSSNSIYNKFHLPVKNILLFSIAQPLATGESVCHDKTSELIMVFESGARQAYNFGHSYESEKCFQDYVVASVIIDLDQFLFEPISMMSVLFKNDEKIQKNIIFDEMLGSDFANNIQTAAIEAKKISNAEMTVNQVMTHTE